MSNVCISCGAEIPDEGSSWICRRCYNEAHSDKFAIDTIHPQHEDVVIVSLDFNKNIMEEAQRIFENLSQVFPDNYVVAVPDYVCIKTMRATQLKGLINDLEELYNSIVNKEE